MSAEGGRALRRLSVPASTRSRPDYCVSAAMACSEQRLEEPVRALTQRDADRVLARLGRDARPGVGLDVAGRHVGVAAGRAAAGRVEFGAALGVPERLHR